MKVIQLQMVNDLAEKSQHTPRKRLNYNFHQSAEDTMHRMLNALQPGSYIAPHKHENPDKAEAFLIMKGRVLVVCFTEQGAPSKHVILDRDAGNFGAEIPPRTYHTLVALEPDSVIYEVKDGPWDIATDKVFAPWAPLEGEEGCQAYIQKLLNQIDVVV